MQSNTAHFDENNQLLSVNETLQVFHLRKKGGGGSINNTTIKLPALVWVRSTKRHEKHKTGGKFRVAGKAEPVPLG